MESPEPLKSTQQLSYAQAGVDTASTQHGLSRLISWVSKTTSFRATIGAPVLEIGHFANVVDIGHGLGMAISTDGVGSKLLIAQEQDHYETVGQDCVAVNVNDVLCVGAEPITMVDCITLEEPHPSLLEELGRGLYRGAELAHVAIVGGEIAQIPEMVKGPRPGYAFDIVGTCVGLVPLDRIIVGQNVEEGDVVIGLASSGIHSNGMTLARKALLENGAFTLQTYVPELDRSLGDELLEPTHIYAQEILAMLNAKLRIKALAHISGDGLLNLARVQAPVGYILEQLPEPPPIFQLIQKAGMISNAEMFTVFNMGIGFCVVVNPEDASQVINIANDHRIDAHCLGYAVNDPQRRIVINPHRLTSTAGRFQPLDGSAE